MVNRRRFWIRVALKAALLFVLFNAACALLPSLEPLGRISLYNGVWTGRSRLPYGEDPARDYNVTLNNLPAMFASHRLDRPKAADEFRVLLLGDSNTWGWLLTPEETLSARLNARDLRLADGRRALFYNAGYPLMALSKDLLLLDEALAHEPDLIVWLVTLESFPWARQLTPPPVQHNPERMGALIDAYDLAINPADDRFVAPSFWERTVVGRRRPLADLLRLQVLGGAWTATEVDQFIPAEIELRSSDFEEDVSWQQFQEPAPLDDQILAYDVLEAGIARAAPVPVVVINEPIFISSGRNSDLRYNSFYPRWAYDAYRRDLAERAADHGWTYLDLWDVVPAAHFTDTPIHLTPAGTDLLAGRLADEIQTILTEE